MSKSNGVVFPLILLFISTSGFIQKFAVFASPVGESSPGRPDPLRHFKPYDGVYDIRNKHYWASAAFTGIHGYAIAGIWLIFGVGFGSYIILKNRSGNSSPAPNQPDSSLYIVMFSLIVLFSLFAIIAVSFQMAANENCRWRTNKLKKIIFRAARNTSQEMRRVINTLIDMQKILVPYDAVTCNLLNVTTHRLRRELLSVQKFVKNIEQPTNKALGVLYFTNLMLLILNMALLVAASILKFQCSFILFFLTTCDKSELVRLMACCFGSVLLILHCNTGILVSFFCLFSIIFCSWILTTFSCVLTGIDYFFHTFAEDTCSAFEKLKKNPEDSSLEFINPCRDSTDSEKLLVQIGFTIHNFITTLNSKLTEFREVSGLEAGRRDSFGARTVCDPFTGAPNYTYSPGICPKDAIPIGDLRNVLSEFTCHTGTSATKCLGDGRFLTEASYLMAGAYSQAIQDLLDVFPDLLSLTGCSSVKQAFSDIAVHQCKPFKRSTRMLWSSSLSLSIVMTILVLLWVAKAKQDRQRAFSKFSIAPNPL